MDRTEFIQHAFDANAFTTFETTAGYVNPEIWEKDTLSYVKANLVMEQLGKVYDRTAVAGDTFNITVGVAPTAAAAVVETNAVAYFEFTKTQAQFAPSEKAIAYQVSQKELDRTFLNTMQELIEQIGYGIALAIDTDIVSTLQSGAGNAYIVNGVAESAMTSSDTLDYDSIVKGRMLCLQDNTRPYALVVNPYQESNLLTSQQFSYVQNFGDSVAKNGFIGKIAGLDVYVSTQIPTSNNKSKALILAKDASGVPPFGTLYKRNPYILRDMDIDFRMHKFVGVVDYDVEVLRANGICTVESYTA